MRADAVGQVFLEPLDRLGEHVVRVVVEPAAVTQDVPYRDAVVRQQPRQIAVDRRVEFQLLLVDQLRQQQTSRNFARKSPIWPCLSRSSKRNFRSSGNTIKLWKHRFARSRKCASCAKAGLPLPVIRLAIPREQLTLEHGFSSLTF